MTGNCFGCFGRRDTQVPLSEFAERVIYYSHTWEPRSFWESLRRRLLCLRNRGGSTPGNNQVIPRY